MNVRATRTWGTSETVPDPLTFWIGVVVIPVHRPAMDATDDAMKPAHDSMSSASLNESAAPGRCLLSGETTMFSCHSSDNSDLTSSEVTAVAASTTFIERISVPDRAFPS
ncbi:unannotated protein [freshwater metagenome]|uniref:Unannotated protein n=1 Tax=freshwater metagenome TaxID=449393 RepID=A0A6J7J7Q2_9ZZZZ